MDRIDAAVREYKNLDMSAREDTFLTRIHPLAKLIVTVYDIVLIVSFHKYNLSGLLGMILYPLLIFNLGALSFREAISRLRIVLPLVCIVGILNPLFDRQVLFWLGKTAVTGGMVSCLTLMIKGILAVLASYILAATTPVEKICHAMRLLHIPRILVTEILLISRYVTLLMEEAGKVTQAYALRAPGQKGIAMQAWGSLAGQMLLRAMDRAGQLYESMRLRGFYGEFDFCRGRQNGAAGIDIAYLCGWVMLLTLIRFVPVMEWIGRGLELVVHP